MKFHANRPDRANSEVFHVGFAAAERFDDGPLITGVHLDDNQLDWFQNFVFNFFVDDFWWGHLYFNPSRRMVSIKMDK